ncbi:chemotaxis protein CheB [Massilia sp. CCM 9210]|uniref:chemotaxis protein CheB n=1 Tax=Massilia scottii TaxID=3057166 RepID=UPI0027967453|nr:chemotaxis protein CheB [Massilia sp. CCM 9210]MDQ1816309.1 chemotaxis protein CheB [Massilia sp. CCM 9210]
MNNLIVIGASAGGVEALTRMLSDIPQGFPAAILIVMHIGQHPSILPQILARRCALPVSHARHHEELKAGMVLIAPPDRHLLVEQHGTAWRTVVTRGPKENHTRPAIDTLFRSAALSGGKHVIGVILTGYLDDGTAGLQAIKARGGKAMVQDPADAIVPDMPRHALHQVAVDMSVPLAGMAGALVALVEASAAPMTPQAAPAPDWIDIENNFAMGLGNMDQLKHIATPSQYSCPECGGALFQLNIRQPCRFRCHTGHSYTLLALVEQQDAAVEAALSSALRALQEKESLAEQLAAELIGRSMFPEPGYAALARQARTDAGILREVLSRQQGGSDGSED